MEALPSVSVEVRALSGEVVCETFLVSRGITVKELKEACMTAARVKGTHTRFENISTPLA